MKKTTNTLEWKIILIINIYKMIYSKKWTSIIETIIVMLIVVIWVVWMYRIFVNSQRVSDSSSYRVQAISMAREWIEAYTNIRDTNWLIYWANIESCWNTPNWSFICFFLN